MMPIQDENFVVKDCLISMGMNLIANQIKHDTSFSALQGFVDIARSEATKKKHHEVLERLQFAGLIY